MNSINDGLGGDDEFHEDPSDNVGNRADGPPTHDGPRPPRFEGEGQGRRERMGLRHGGPRRDRGPRRNDPQQYGNGHPFAGNPPPDRGNVAPRGERGPRHDQQPRFDQAPRHDQQPRFDQGPRPEGAERGPRPEGDFGGRGGRGRGRRGRNRGGDRPRFDDQQPQQQGQPLAQGAARPEGVMPERPRGGIREDECKVYGVNACLAVFQQRPDAIIRAYVNNETLRRFGYTMKFLAEQRRAYHVISDQEMYRVTETEHHGGVCFVIRKRVPLMVPEFLQLFGELPQARAVLLDGVANPHNVGAILRTAAHFGVDGVLLEDAGGIQGGAGARVAEGATESLRLVQFRGAARTLEALKAAGFKVIVTSSHATQSVYDTTLPEKAVFVLGAEERGASEEALAAADLQLAIPGSGAIESLNVSVAAGVVLSELYRRHGAAGVVQPVASTKVYELAPETVAAPVAMPAPDAMLEEATPKTGDPSQPQP
jgi:TrmH RNA methyltransferase